MTQPLNTEGSARYPADVTSLVDYRLSAFRKEQKCLQEIVVTLQLGKSWVTIQFMPTNDNISEKSTDLQTQKQ